MTKEEVEKFIKKHKSNTTIISSGGGIRTLRHYPSYRLVESGVEIESWGGKNLLRFEEITALYDRIIDTSASLSFGSDPELFFVKDGEVIPSTAVMDSDTSRVTRDGFQVELHPSSNHCRQVAGTNIAQCMHDVFDIARTKGVELSFAVAHRISDAVWKRTNKETKRFGCNPTENVHEKKQKRSTGMREKFRAGGGHIHVGNLTSAEKADLPTIVKLFDIVVGNTLVLVDRDENNKERRKNYGRAGEYRPKPYGVEYRVPSNFWLRHYVLWSFVSGLIGNAMLHYRNGFAKDIISKFNMKDIRDAINNNDYDLAMKNFLIYKEIIEKLQIPEGRGVHCKNAGKFLAWAREDKPLEKLNDGSAEAIKRHWIGLSGVSSVGFETWINRYREYKPKKK